MSQEGVRAGRDCNKFLDAVAAPASRATVSGIKPGTVVH